MVTFRNKARHYLKLAMNNPTWDAYWVSAYMDITRKRFDEAVSFAEKAVLIAPNEHLANISHPQLRQTGDTWHVYMLRT